MSRPRGIIIGNDLVDKRGERVPGYVEIELQGTRRYSAIRISMKSLIKVTKILARKTNKMTPAFGSTRLFLNEETPPGVEVKK